VETKFTERLERRQPTAVFELATAPEPAIPGEWTIGWRIVSDGAASGPEGTISLRVTKKRHQVLGELPDELAAIAGYEETLREFIQKERRRLAAGSETPKAAES